MQTMMSGVLLFLASLVAPDVRPLPPAPSAMQNFRPAAGATARATASIRIIAGVSFGEGRSADIPGAMQRSVRLEESPGVLRDAQILEFQ